MSDRGVLPAHCVATSERTIAKDGAVFRCAVCDNLLVRNDGRLSIVPSSDRPDIDRLADEFREILAAMEAERVRELLANGALFMDDLAALAPRLDELVALARLAEAARVAAEDDVRRQDERAMAAEARVSELEAALQRIADFKHPLGMSTRDSLDKVQGIARAALDGDGGGA